MGSMGVKRKKLPPTQPSRKHKELPTRAGEFGAGAMLRSGAWAEMPVWGRGTGQSPSPPRFTTKALNSSTKKVVCFVGGVHTPRWGKAGQKTRGFESPRRGKKKKKAGRRKTDRGVHRGNKLGKGCRRAGNWVFWGDPGVENGGEWPNWRKDSRRETPKELDQKNFWVERRKMGYNHRKKKEKTNRRREEEFPSPEKSGKPPGQKPSPGEGCKGAMANCKTTSKTPRPTEKEKEPGKKKAPGSKKNP